MIFGRLFYFNIWFSTIKVSWKWSSFHQRRHGPTRVRGHAFIAYIYYVTAAGYISSQLASSCQGNRYVTVKVGGTARPSQNHTCWVTLLQPARRATVLGQPYSLRPHWFSLKHWPGTETVHAVVLLLIFTCRCCGSGPDLTFFKRKSVQFLKIFLQNGSVRLLLHTHTVYH
jgi:hypothetical protein